MRKAPRSLRTDGEATYNRILEAAGELFAVSGFAETSSKAIAAQAGADLASINYHFGSRGGLYQAVLAEAHRRLVSIDQLQKIATLDVSPRDKLKMLIERLVGTATGRLGWPSRVLGRELLSPSSHLQVLERQELLPKLNVVLGILSEFTSIPVDDPVLLRCLVSVGAPCAMLLVAGHGVSIFEEKVLGMPREVLADHLYTFAMGGLDAITRNYAKGS